MDENPTHTPSQLFTVRVWLETIEGGQSEWRGQVQHVTSGEARYFRDWRTLIAHILEMLGQFMGDLPPDITRPDRKAGRS